MVSYHAEKTRADKLQEKLMESAGAIQKERDRADQAEYERDCYLEVLLGMEFRETEKYPEYGKGFCHMLGAEAAKRMKKAVGK